MSSVTVFHRDGSQIEIPADPGSNLMELLRDNGVDDILALCGGCCSCATCHVYVEAAPGNEASDVGDDESDLLDSSEHRQPNSRLACQVQVAGGMTIRVAPED